MMRVDNFLCQWILSLSSSSRPVCAGHKASDLSHLAYIPQFPPLFLVERCIQHSQSLPTCCGSVDTLMHNMRSFLILLCMGVDFKRRLVR